MWKYVIAAVVALVIVVALLIPKPAAAAYGDISVVRVSTCSSTTCVVTETTYRENMLGQLEVLSTTTKVIPRYSYKKEQ